MKGSALDFEILTFTEPSQIIEVNFKRPALDLFHYSTKISKDQDDNNTLNKLIANVNYGLLDKSQNTKTKSVVLNSIKEARHFQVKYGGTLATMPEYELKEEEVHNNYHADLDKGVNFTDDGDELDDVNVSYAKVFHPTETRK